MLLKVNGYTLSESNSVIFILGLLLNRDQFLKQRICSSRSKFYPLRVDLILESFRSVGKLAGSRERFCPVK